MLRLILFMDAFFCVCLVELWNWVFRPLNSLCLLTNYNIFWKLRPIRLYLILLCYFSDFCVPASSKIEVFEGARDNLPDADAHHAALAVLDLAKNLHDTDILIVLISGNEYISTLHCYNDFSLPEQSSWRAIVLPPASALAFAFGIGVHKC